MIGAIINVSQKGLCLKDKIGFFFFNQQDLTEDYSALDK